MESTSSKRRKTVEPPHNTISTIDGKYRLLHAVGSGSFGEIYRGVNIRNGNDVAIKIERQDCKSPQLAYEATVYDQLSAVSGLPLIYHYGAEQCFNVLVMELLGPSLEDLFNTCNRHFSLKTVLILIDLMLTRLQCVHNCGFIHRDVKPDNYLMGLGNQSNKLYIIDFGLAKRYTNQYTAVHIPFRKYHNLAGTLRYASIKAQLGHEQSRRDDLESLSYCLMYFNVGKLPWQGLTANSMKQKYEKILEKKRNFCVEQLSADWPIEFALFMKYCRNLNFDATPDYLYLQQLLHTVFNNSNYQYNYEFDWILLARTKLTEEEKSKQEHNKHNMENKSIKNN